MRVLILGLLLLTGACTKPSIHGVWEYEDDGVGEYSFAHYAYLEDGRKCTVLFRYSDSAIETTVFLNTWELDDGVMTLKYGPNTSVIREGYSSRSRIDKISTTHLAYTIFDSSYAVGTSEVLIRLPNADPERVCDLVNRELDVPDKEILSDQA